MALQQNAKNVSIEVTVKQNGVVVDLSTVTAKTFYVKKPDGTTIVQWTASFKTNGTDGILKYLTQTGDLNLVGVYQLQPSITFPGSGYDGFCDIVEFTVEENVS